MNRIGPLLALAVVPCAMAACGDDSISEPFPPGGTTTTTTTSTTTTGSGGSGAAAGSGGGLIGGSGGSGATAGSGGSGATGGSGGGATGGSGGGATGGSGGSGATGGSGGSGGGGSVCSGSSTIVINEVRYDPPNNDGGNEWIELYNVSGGAIDISQWTIESGTSGTYSVRFTFPASTLLASHDYVVVGGGDVTDADFQSASALNFGNATNPDAIRIRDDDGNVVDTVIYGPAGTNPDSWLDDCGEVASVYAPDGYTSQTIARSPNGTDTNDCSADFIATNTITMGAANP